MNIKCLVVDDEPASQDVLIEYINSCPDLELIQVCSNAFEANEVLNDHENIRLIFLDISMPKLSGMKFYRSLSNPPYVIFTTAYPEYAIEGFEVDAVDYLLKPFPFERFLKAVNKVFEKLKSQQTKGNGLQVEDFILLKSDKKIHKVDLGDIFYLESIGDYVKVYFKDKNIIVHGTLQGLASQLDPDRFVRVHKSFVISIHRFDYIEGNMIKILDTRIPIGQTYKANFLDRIKQRGSG